MAVPSDDLAPTAPLRNEDDFTHYFNATQRLSLENWHLRSAVAEIRERMGDGEVDDADIAEIFLKWSV